jgi:hypothetical protein
MGQDQSLLPEVALAADSAATGWIAAPWTWVAWVELAGTAAVAPRPRWTFAPFAAAQPASPIVAVDAVASAQSCAATAAVVVVGVDEWRPEVAAAAVAVAEAPAAAVAAVRKAYPDGQAAFYRSFELKWMAHSACS